MEKKLLNTVLVVEDNVYYQQMVALMIKPHAKQVLCFSNAEDALKILETTPVDLMIADFYLEGMLTGEALLSHCCLHHPETELIFMSSDDRVASVLEVPEYDNVIFIQKNKEALSVLEKDLFRILRKQYRIRDEKHSKMLFQLTAVIVFLMIGVQVVSNLLTNR